MEFVGEDKLLDMNAARAQGVGEHRSLGVGHFGVVVAVDQQDRRLPFGYIRHGGGSMGKGSDFLLLGERAAEPVGGGVVFAGPLVDAVEVDAGGEEVGVAGEGESGEIAAVASAPDAYVGDVDVRPRAEIGDSARERRCIRLRRPRRSAGIGGSRDRSRCLRDS